MVHTVEEHDPLLSGRQQESYDSVNVQEDYNMEASIPTLTGGDDTDQADVVLMRSGPMLGHHGRIQQRRNTCSSGHSLLLNSTKPLKCLAMGFGLWSELGRWTLALIVPIALFVFFVLMVLSLMFIRYVRNTEFDNFVLLFAEVPSYFVMVHCIRHLHKHHEALQLKQAFQMVKKSKWINLLLVISLIMITTSQLLANCFPIYGPLLSSQFTRTPLYLSWLMFFSLVSWQAIVGCFVFDIVIKALITLVEQCRDKIISEEGDSVNHYIRIHQELCRTIESTFAAYRKWFIVSTFAYIAVLIWVVIRIFSLTVTYRSLPSITYINRTTSRVYKNLGLYQDQGILSFQYFFTLFLYSSFICVYPWSCVASLKTSLNRLIQKLNSKTDWNPHHPFSNRSHLNDFIQYAKNIKYQTFIQFTLSAKLLYISICLTLSGLIFSLFILS